MPHWPGVHTGLLTVQDGQLALLPALHMPPPPDEEDDDEPVPPEDELEEELDEELDDVLDEELEELLDELPAPDELELDELLLEDELDELEEEDEDEDEDEDEEDEAPPVGTEHSFTPPFTRVPKVAVPHTKLPVSCL